MRVLQNVFMSVMCGHFGKMFELQCDVREDATNLRNTIIGRCRRSIKLNRLIENILRKFIRLLPWCCRRILDGIRCQIKTNYQ